MVSTFVFPSPLSPVPCPLSPVPLALGLALETHLAPRPPWLVVVVDLDLDLDLATWKQRGKKEERLREEQGKEK